MAKRATAKTPPSGPIVSQEAREALAKEAAAPVAPGAVAAVEDPPAAILHKPNGKAVCEPSASEVAHALALGAGIHNPEEVETILAEQKIGPRDRAEARHRRKANETLCQLIESSAAFKAALEAERT